MSTGARLGILAGIVAAAIVVLVVAGGGSSDKSKTTTNTAATSAATTSTGTAVGSTTTTTPAGQPTFTVTVKGGKPAGGIEKIKVNKGDQVKLVVKSDVADEVHVHGYDLKKDVKAGGTARISFKATIDGAFEIELEHAGQQIAELTVEP